MSSGLKPLFLLSQDTHFGWLEILAFNIMIPLDAI